MRATTATCRYRIQHIAERLCTPKMPGEPMCGQPAAPGPLPTKTPDGAIRRAAERASGTCAALAPVDDPRSSSR